MPKSMMLSVHILPVVLLFYTVSFGPGFAPYVFKMASSQQKWSIEIILNRRISTEQRQVPWGGGGGSLVPTIFLTVITITKHFLYLVAIGHHKFDYTGFNCKK